jgi:hypothetical protein
MTGIVAQTGSLRYDSNGSGAELINKAQQDLARTPSPRLSGERDGVRGFELEYVGLLTPPLSSFLGRRGRRMAVVSSCAMINIWE